MNLANLRKWIGPLASRKVRIALATVLTAYLVERFGVNVSEETVYTVVGVGVALILGIAHEDNGSKAANGHNKTE